MNKEIPYLFNKRVVFLPKKVYKVFADEGKLDSLAFYIQNKKRFKNSKVFNYSLQRLNQITGLSIGTLSKHITALRRLGLIKIENKVLTFINPKKLTQYANKAGKIKMSYYKVMGSYKTQKIFLKNFKAICNLQKQQRLIDSTSNKKKGKRSLASKAIQKRNRKGIKYQTLSIFRYSQIVDKSMQTVCRYKRILENENVITQKQRFKKTHFSINDYKSIKNNAHFLNFNAFKLRIINNLVMIQQSNEIIPMVY